MASTTLPVSSDSFHNAFVADAGTYPSQPASRHRSASSSGLIDAGHLSPHRPPRSNSASPNQHTGSHTPADSFSTFEHCQSSDFGGDDDPFFGVDFSNEGGTPTFLEDSFAAASKVSPKQSPFSPPTQAGFIMGATGVGANPSTGPGSNYPLTPDLANSPQLTRKQTLTSPPLSLPNSVSPQELQRPFNPPPSGRERLQLTPGGSCHSSDDGLPSAPSTAPKPIQSPLVTVSDWGKGPLPLSHAVDPPPFEPDTLVRPPSARSTPGDLILNLADGAAGPFRDNTGTWLRDPATGHGGLDPENRPRTAIDSVNDLVSRREIEERKKVVASWLDQNSTDPLAPVQPRTSLDRTEIAEDGQDDGIPLGDKTENKFVSGQTYFVGRGGELTSQDLEIIYSNRNWADAPQVHPITANGTKRYQPESSQAAIAQFERMCQDNASIISDAATWGTRRRSVAALTDIDVEGLSGNLLKKLTISRGDPRKQGGGLLNGFRTLVRKPSATLKRSFSGHDETNFANATGEKPDTTAHLAPPTRTSSWGKKPTPSINTALVSMGQSVAAVGAGQAGQAHGRSGSISATSVTSPKSPFGGLTVKNTIRRPRSKSDLPRSNTKLQAGSNLADLWKKNGGPPVGTIATSTITVPFASTSITHPISLDAEEDDDDDLDFEDSEMRIESSGLIEMITPTFDGFKSHILRLNPTLSPSSYLVDRIAQQQVIRYKALLNAKVKHMQQGPSCLCGPLCVALGGSARPLDQKGEPRNHDNLSSPDNDMTPIEGVLTPDSFPQDIPMPPTSTLPAEIECQLCYQAKKFQKPSDWTKHVHEDVQPFTCTWERCREPKIFKRKADWVRHENEGHRHLEWWECDVDDCTHKCYRRDNFLQHLVREHKFDEPRYKTKAALKKHGGNDPTWQKVEQCHVETEKRAQEEPCRFCGKQLPSWKKLTVHLAKHMEQISLPTLRLVAIKNVTADTVVSPVQDKPRALLDLQSSPDPLHSAYSTSGFGGNTGPQKHSPMGTVPVSITYQSSTSVFDLNMNSALGSNSFQDSYVVRQFSSDAMENELRGQNVPDIANSGQGRAMYGQSPPGHSSFQPAQGLQRVQSLPIDTNSYMGSANSNTFIAVPPSAESFSATSTGLGLQDGTGYMGVPINLGGMMDPGEASFTHQGSVSPYSSSPHQASAGHFYQAQ
ncbi:hypothetical protein jhhlp_002264 [Lomentospora prolificans]|uniref:C2H2-type domain-containing protein n=1 Tax=Lomentospora prolificans TaxID=41688 RepID=A0A2N3NDS9_9PEZI|nr:hypothetical protein jhhlp_002264 [Lomentospora prolificans]